MALFTGSFKPVHRIKTRVWVGYADWLFLCFLIGIVAGTAAANVLYPQMKEQAVYFTGLLEKNMYFTGAEQRELFWWILRQRSVELLFMWLVSLTVFAVPCYYMMTAGFGFSAGVILTVFTCQKGVLGILWYLASLFPHFLIYIPVWCVLARWAGERSKKPRVLALGALFLLILTGALMESIINPLLLKICF